jgi:hypothetical protein
VRPIRRFAAGLVVLLAVAGCARPPLLPRPGNGGLTSVPGRVLVIARQTTPENRGIADRGAELVAQGLRPAGEVWDVGELLREATAAAASPWAVSLAQRLATGGFPTMDDRVELLKFAVTGLIVTEVTMYDQVWGKYAKFTRVGIEARAYDVIAGAVVWRVHRGVEVEDLRGRAFDRGIESAVNGLLAAIAPGTAYSAMDLWREWRR